MLKGLPKQLESKGELSNSRLQPTLRFASRG